MCVATDPHPAREKHARARLSGAREAKLSAEAEARELEARLGTVESELSEFHAGQEGVAEAIATLEARHEERYMAAEARSTEASAALAGERAALAAAKAEGVALREELARARDELERAREETAADIERAQKGFADGSRRAEELRARLAGEAAVARDDSAAARAECARAAAAAEEACALRERAEARAARAEAAAAEAGHRAAEAKAAAAQARAQLTGARDDAQKSRRAAALAVSARDATDAERARLEAELRTWRSGATVCSGDDSPRAEALRPMGAFAELGDGEEDSEHLAEENALLVEMSSVALQDNALLKRRLADRRDECDDLAGRVAALTRQVEHLSAAKAGGGHLSRSSSGGSAIAILSPPRAGGDVAAHIEAAAEGRPGELVLRSVTTRAVATSPTAGRQGAHEQAAFTPGGSNLSLSALRGHRARISRLEKVRLRMTLLYLSRCDCPLCLLTLARIGK